MPVFEISQPHQFKVISNTQSIFIGSLVKIIFLDCMSGNGWLRCSHYIS